MIAQIVLLYFTLGCAMKNTPVSDSRDPNAGELQVVQEIRSRMIPMTFPVTFDGSEPRVGSSKDMFQLVQFSDFECSSSSEASQILIDIAAKPNVSLRFKHYPMSNICNPSVSSVFHEHSCTASMAAECAHKQGHFWKMSRYIFARQSDLARSSLDRIAVDVGLEEEDYANCMKDSSTLDKIRSDIKSGKQVNVTATPSIFIGYQGSWYKWEDSIDQLSSVFMVLQE